MRELSVRHQSKHELVEALQGRYLRASRVEKGWMLDEVVAATGYGIAPGDPAAYVIAIAVVLLAFVGGPQPIDERSGAAPAIGDGQESSIGGRQARAEVLFGRRELLLGGSSIPQPTRGDRFLRQLLSSIAGRLLQ